MEMARTHDAKAKQAKTMEIQKDENKAHKVVSQLR
jgi:hypothetical protein